jgi:hypothetical protein
MMSVARTNEMDMVVGVGMIILKIHDCRSLKEKRRVVKSMIAQLRNNFNASVSEVGSNDVYQRAEIGFTVVGNDHQLINAKIEKMFNMADELGIAEVVDTDFEIIHM